MFYFLYRLNRFDVFLEIHVYSIWWTYSFGNKLFWLKIKETSSIYIIVINYQTNLTKWLFECVKSAKNTYDTYNFFWLHKNFEQKYFFNLTIIRDISSKWWHDNTESFSINNGAIQFLFFFFKYKTYVLCLTFQIQILQKKKYKTYPIHPGATHFLLLFWKWYFPNKHINLRSLFITNVNNGFETYKSLQTNIIANYFWTNKKYPQLIGISKRQHRMLFRRFITVQ